MAAARAAWCDSQGALNPARLIFIDETWIATNMIRGYGRSPRGERLVGTVPYGHWKTTTFVAGLRCDGLTAPFVIDGPINGEWFRTYAAARNPCAAALRGLKISHVRVKRLVKTR